MITPSCLSLGANRAHVYIKKDNCVSGTTSKEREQAERGCRVRQLSTHEFRFFYLQPTSSSESNHISLTSWVQIDSIQVIR